jgi:hypothetical protein
MQLITQFIDPSDATEANSRLRRAGVMTEITSLDPHIMSSSKTGALRIGLWVVFEDQFDDAVRLLEDPDHVPHRVIPLSEMNRIKSTTDDSWLESGQKKMANLATLIFGACLLGLVVYVAIGLLNDA